MVEREKDLAEPRFKRNPLSHQREHVQRDGLRKVWGLLWEQGCAKTAPVIVTFDRLYREGQVDCLLIVAPPGVERNWLTDELEQDLPEDTLEAARLFRYQAKRAAAKWHQAECAGVLNHVGPIVVAITYDSFMTESGKKWIWKLLQRRKVLYVLDESHHIKSPGAKRTKSIVASGRYAEYRRILTGTPVAQGPFDVYSQIRFLSQSFWADRGLGSFQAFKQFFGVWLTREECQRINGYDPGFDKLIEYKNIPQLESWLREISDRKLKSEVLDLPEKLYSKRYFEMTLDQDRIYKQLRDKYELELDEGEVEEVELAIVRLLRLQQITCGYVAINSEEPIKLIGNHNPRLELLKEICADLPHQCIIWARFSKDIDQICAALGDEATRYDGKISDDQCEINQNLFKKGLKKYIVANAAKGKEGLTWHMAKTVIYYSNSFKLIDRLQSEDRAHRAGMDKNPVHYIDLVATTSTSGSTVDKGIVDALRAKFNIAGQVNGDRLREWI